MSVFSSLFLFLWVQVPGIGPKAKASRQERSRHCSERVGGGSVMLKRPEEMKEGERKLWGGGKERANRVGCVFRGEGGGVGRSRSNP